MNIPKTLRYAKTHEWVRVEGPTAVVGITDYAQEALGDIVYVELPAPDAPQFSSTSAPAAAGATAAAQRTRQAASAMRSRRVPVIACSCRMPQSSSFSGAASENGRWEASPRPPVPIATSVTLPVRPASQ